MKRKLRLIRQKQTLYVAIPRWLVERYELMTGDRAEVEEHGEDEGIVYITYKIYKIRR